MAVLANLSSDARGGLLLYEDAIAYQSWNQIRGSFHPPEL